jgi:rhamnulokinase
VLGPLLPAVAEGAGLGAARSVPVIATAGHDTAAAAAGLPSQEEHPTFISSGTWSVMGTELAEPLLKPEGLAGQFFVETAACGRQILVHNSMGLWPVQECRREWLQQGHNWSYADLVEMAARAPAFAAIVDPDDWSFFQPGDMTAKVNAYCRRTGQEPPADPASVARSLFEGLALRYRRTLDDLQALTGWPSGVLHIIGGGSRNALLCQFAADATGHPVLAGPSEAAAMATVLLQALAQGRLGSLGELRAVVARSSAPVAYEARPAPAWEDAYARFARITG